jgi:hypothetical protein
MSPELRTRLLLRQSSLGDSLANLTQAELQKHADARVANAIAIIKNDPVAQATLNKLSQLALDAGKRALEPFLQSAKSEVLNQINSLVSSIGPELSSTFAGLSSVVSSAADIISSAAPVINVITGMWSALAQQSAAGMAAHDDPICQASRAVGVARSGAEGSFVSSDIFLPGGQEIAQIYFSKDEASEERLYPYSSLGRTFVGIFEWRNNLSFKKDGGPWDCYTDQECSLIGDYPQYHTRAAYKRLSAWYREHTEQGKKEPNAGLMPESRMQLIKSLRLAMAARSSYAPMLFGIYLDLARDCIEKGWVTGDWADFMMSHMTWPLDNDGNLFTHFDVTGSKYSYAVINPPNLYPTNGHYTVQTDGGDREFQNTVAGISIASGGWPWNRGSACGEHGWLNLVESVFSIVRSKPKVSQKELDDDIAKARSTLSRAQITKNGIRIPRQILLDLANKVTSKKKAPKSNRSLELTKSQTILLVGGLGAGAALLGYLYLRQKKK